MFFLLRQFFRTIPAELSEAARIDGCGEFRIFWKIILPLCKPALVVVALFTFLGAWNDFLGPLIYLTDERDFTLSAGLQAMENQLIRRDRVALPDGGEHSSFLRSITLFLHSSAQLHRGHRALLPGRKRDLNGWFLCDPGRQKNHPSHRASR